MKPQPEAAEGRAVSDVVAEIQSIAAEHPGWTHAQISERCRTHPGKGMVSYALALKDPDWKARRRAYDRAYARARRVGEHNPAAIARKAAAEAAEAVR